MNEQTIERAARKLCELRGINPDQMIPHGAQPDARGFVPAVLCHSPAWVLVSKEVRACLQVDTAIDFARSNP